MQKVRLLVHSTDVDAALEIIQRNSALEFRATEMADTTDTDISFPHEQLLPRVQHAIQFLKPYEKEIGLWRTLREGSQTVLSEADITKYMQDTDAVSAIVDDLESLQVEFADKNEKLRLLQENLDVIEEWKTLPIKLSDLETKNTTTLLIRGHQATENSPLEKQLSELCKKNDIAFLLTVVSAQAAALTIEKKDETINKVKQLLEDIDAEISPIPSGVETPDVEFVAVTESIAKVNSDLALLHDQAEHFAITHIKQLQIAGEVLSWQKDRFSVVSNAAATKHTVVFDGWLNQNKRAEIEMAFEKKNIAAVFTDLDLADGEEPPVDIENSAFFRPFEAVTRLYGMPGYRDLDPTAFLAGFFFLFFGLSLTDVGYGLFLMTSSLIVLTLFKVSESLRLFAKLLFLAGLATVLVGMLFGGYFGISPDSLPDFLRAIQMFDPIGNPLPVFYLALGLGVFQVMVGMLVKIYSEYKQGRLVTGILDQGPWFLMFCLGIFYLATALGYTSILSVAQIVNLIYVNLVLIVLSSGRHGETIFEKIKDSLASLYSSIGYFSDILSYSRLLALGLATTALAFAVNMIAGMVFNKESYISYILAGAILVIGHLFTLAVNTLGAFIHSARLQFVEFFGKFITGTGKEFAPLSRTDKHITVRDE